MTIPGVTDYYGILNGKIFLSARTFLVDRLFVHYTTHVKNVYQNPDVYLCAYIFKFKKLVNIFDIGIAFTCKIMTFSHVEV